MPEIEILPESGTLAERAAEVFIALASSAVAARGRFSVALSGGSTPEAMYALLAAPDRSSLVDWSKSLLFVGDERIVPPDDPRSNFGLAKRTLLDRISIPPANLFPVPIHADAAASAQAYEEILRQAFGNGADVPVFDLILLGLGDDGHTASLFPGMPALHVTDRWVAGTPPGVLPPSVDRVTLTFPVINAARHVVFLAGGEKKADTVCDVLAGNFAVEERPAVGVRPEHGELIWLLDKAAASKLPAR
jgi:6-phosphogluconolactonase